jgi:hypothetical protein
VGDIQQMEKVHGGKTRERVLIHMGRMTIGEFESPVSPEDRNLRNPVPDVTCFILNTPFRMSFGDQVRS